MIALVVLLLAVIAVAVTVVVLQGRGQRATRARLAEVGGQLAQARAALAEAQVLLDELQRAAPPAAADPAATAVATEEAQPPPAADPPAAGGLDIDLLPAATVEGATAGAPSDDPGTGTVAGVEVDSLAPLPADGGVKARDDAGILEALWALTALGQTRARRVAEAMSTAAPSSRPPGGIAAGLEDEVGRLREETGTPGTLRVALDAEPPPGEAELLLRSVQALLAVLSRHCQGYDLYVHQWDSRLLAVLVCEGFDGPDSVADEASEVLAALSPVSGRIEIDRDPQGRLRARLSLPAA